MGNLDLTLQSQLLGRAISGCIKNNKWLPFPDGSRHRLPIGDTGFPDLARAATAWYGGPIPGRLQTKLLADSSLSLRTNPGRGLQWGEPMLDGLDSLLCSALHSPWPAQYPGSPDQPLCTLH